VRLREITAAMVDRALRAIGQHSGYGAAASTRTAVSGMFTLAVHRGAMAVNPIRMRT
jgi:hypothetical protein